MGELYVIYFFNSGVSFVNWQWCWVIGLIFLLFSFFNFSAKNHAYSMALGNRPVLVTKLKRQSV